MNGAERMMASQQVRPVTRFLQDLPIQAKAALAAGLLLLCLLALGLHAFTTSVRVAGGLHTLSADLMTKQEAFSEISRTVSAIHIKIFRYVSWASNGVSEKLLTPLSDEITAEIGKVSERVDALAKNPRLSAEENAAIVQLSRKWQATKSQADDTLSIGQTDAPMATMMMGQTDDMFQAVDLNFREMSLTTTRAVDALGSQLSASAELNKQVIVIIAALGFLISLTVAVVIGRLIVRPIRSITDVMQRLSAGEINAKIEQGDRRDEIGKMADSIEVFRKNIIDKHMMEQALAEAIEAISEGFSLYDAQDRLVVCNSRYRDLFSYGTDAVVPGMTFEQIISAAIDRGAITEAKNNEGWLAARLARHRAPTQPHIQHRSDGRWVRISERKTTEDGVVATYTDITELKEHEDALARLVQELQATTSSLSASLAQQTATSEVLRVISSSQHDAHPVFDMIAQRAMQVCEGQFCAVFRFDGELIHLVAHHGMSDEGVRAYQQNFPVRPGRINAIGRAIQNCAVVEIPDVLVDTEYGSVAVARAVTFRAIVAVPMMLEGRPIGGIAVSRASTGAFPDKQIDQLRTFADQAVIAIENVRMFRETEDALQRQTATSEILGVISSSPTSTEPVFDSIVRNAVTLCNAVFGIVFRVDAGVISMVANHNLTPEVLELLERLYPMAPSPEHASGRAILTGELVHVHDVMADPNYHRGVASFGGWRSLLAVPMKSREGAAIGVLWVARAAAGPFPDNQITLLQTFAEQAVIAIENVKLFQELEVRTEELTLSSEQLAAVHAQVTALNAQLQSENLRMGSELDVTRRLQLMLLPTPDELESVEGLEIAGHMQPALEVGGDYYDVLQHGGRVKIGIGDVTGHGLESGVLMVMTQAIVRALLTGGQTDHVQFLSTLNHALFGNVQRMGGDKNLTLCLLDYNAGEVRISGQHEELLVVRSSGAVERVNTINLGFPVGLVDDIAQFVGQTTITLQPGDGMVLYTDGITEAENMAGEQYGLERLCALVSRHWSSPSEAIKDVVVADVANYIGTQTVYDDVTLVVLKQKYPENGGAQMIAHNRKAGRT